MKVYSSTTSKVEWGRERMNWTLTERATSMRLQSSVLVLSRSS